MTWRGYVVRYQVATYSGTLTVWSDDPDDESVLAKARRQLVARSGPLPFGVQTFTIVDVIEHDPDDDD